MRRFPAHGEFIGGNILTESLIHVSNVSLIDPEDRCAYLRQEGGGGRAGDVGGM